MDEKIEQTQDSQQDEYEEPTMIDIEDLEDVSGGDICITGGGSQQAV